MTEYSVHGPFRIPVLKKSAGRRIGDVSDFWEAGELALLHKRCGVYVFGMRAGKGVVPYYVGKTTNKFESECFQPHKLDKYNDALAEYRKGRPIIFFLARPVKRGQIKRREVSQIETFLIQMASRKNRELLNIRGNKQPKWSIAGVLRGTQGQPSREAKKFKSMMNM
jgi:hypothetical protein